MCYNDVNIRHTVFAWRKSEQWTVPSTSAVDIELVMTALQRIFIELKYTPYVGLGSESFIIRFRSEVQKPVEMISVNCLSVK